MPATLIARRRLPALGGAALTLAVLAAGCALMPKHSIDISDQLRAHPVPRLFIFDPEMNPKIKRRHPEDYAEMATAGAADSAAHLRATLAGMLSASLIVDGEWQPSREARDWARRIAESLARENVPTGVPPMALPFPAVLLVGVVTYGTELVQWEITPFPLGGSRGWRIGHEKWDHTCDLQVLLVDPTSGHILMDARQSYDLERPARDPAALETVTRMAARVIASAIPVPAGGTAASATGLAEPAAGATVIAGSLAPASASATAATR